MFIIGAVFSFKTVDEQTFQSTTDTVATPDVNHYAGSISPEKQSVNVWGDDRAEVIYKYTRNSYTLILQKGQGMTEVLRYA